MIHFPHYVGTKIWEQKWQWIGWWEGKCTGNPLIISLIDSNYIILIVKTIWLVVCNIFISPYIGNNIPNWRSHIFQRGSYTSNQQKPWVSRINPLKMTSLFVPQRGVQRHPQRLTSALGPRRRVAAHAEAAVAAWHSGTVALSCYEIWQFSEEMTDMTVFFIVF